MGEAPRPVALLTGGATRIAQAVALALAEDGFDIAITFRTSKDAAAATVTQLQARGVQAVALPLEQRSVQSISALFAAFDSHFRRLDLLLNSASLFYSTPLLEVTEAQYDELLEANLKGPFFMAQGAAARMLRNDPPGGLILNLGDVKAERVGPRFAPYLLSKAGLHALTKLLAVELAPSVRVNTLALGPILLPEHYGAALRERAIDTTLLKRVGDVSDVVGAVRFLWTGGGFITGASLPIDGGRLAGSHHYPPGAPPEGSGP